MKKETKLTIMGIFIILAVSFILYYSVLSSDKPLGLDSLGHLSKISYMKEFGFVSWDMSWYNGGPFLKFYSPLFYYIVLLFPNIIFGANFLCFLSIFLTSLGIFLIVKHFSNKITISLISALFFLSVLNTSYYFLSVGNLPYIFSLWTIPFSLFFLEKSFKDKYFFVLYCLTFLVAFLSHIFTGLCIMLLVFLRFLIIGGFNIKNIKITGLFLLVPLFLSSFWLFPFLSHSSNFIGNGKDYIPLPQHLIGFDNYTIWGKGAGEIGISFILFLFFLFFFRKGKGDKIYVYILTSSIILFLLMMGILGKYYPIGIGAVRFINPFSILICIFVGLSLNKFELKNKHYLFLFILLFIALIMSYQIINENYNNYLNNPNGKFNLESQFFYKDFPVNKNYTNYRFGSARFQFSEALTFYFPKISQTSGYYDQGILYSDIFGAMKEGIWESSDINSTLYYMDWFGIKYFELSGGYLGNEKKFMNNTNFKLITNENNSNYPFKIYEYLYPTPIISVIKGNVISYKEITDKEIQKMVINNKNTKSIIPVISNKDISIKNNFSILNSKINRNNPDVVEAEYKFTGKEVILFKEVYYSSWKAKEFPSGRSLEIFKTANNLMVVIPSANSEKVIFYQSKIFIDWLGLCVSLITFLLLILIFIYYNRILTYHNL